MLLLGSAVLLLGSAVLLLGSAVVDELGSTVVLLGSSVAEELGMDGTVPPAANVKPFASRTFFEKEGIPIVRGLFFLNMRPLKL